MRLVGYRAAHAALRTGYWLPGELLGLPLADRPALADPVRLPVEELLVVPEVAAVHYAELDWVHRRARVEIGLADGAAEQAQEVLALAVAHGFTGLNLRRLYGWVTSPHPALAGCGLRAEATVPAAIRVAGAVRPRQLWAVLHDD